MRCPVCSKKMIRVLIPFFVGNTYYGEFEAHSCPKRPVCKIKDIEMAFLTEEATRMIELIAIVKETSRE